MTESLKRQVYTYPMEMLCILVRVVAEIGFYAWFFYKSFWAVLPLLPVGVYKIVINGKKLEKRKNQEFESQFQECIMTVSTALKAGYSLENAFAESVRDMTNMFGEKSRIVKELYRICRGFKNNQSIELELEKLSERCGSDAVLEFTDIVKVVVSNGGNLIEIIESTSEVMNGERQMLEEIRDMISGKKMEGKIMSLIPFLMVLYVECSNPGYFDVFYYNATGICVMTVCLIVYLLATTAMEKILEIVS